MERLKEGQALCVLSDEAMDETVQEKALREFVKEGGRLILCGRVPTRDSWSQSCTLLADMFGICAEEMEDKGDDQQKLKLDGKRNITSAEPYSRLWRRQKIFWRRRMLEIRPYFTLLLARGTASASILPGTHIYSQAEAVKLLLGKNRCQALYFRRETPENHSKAKRQSCGLESNPSPLRKKCAWGTAGCGLPGAV